MLTTVDFDNDPTFEADEIDDMTSQRHLSLKHGAGEAMCTEPIPKPVLGIGRFTPKL
jgi:hypothetical protein